MPTSFALTFDSIPRVHERPPSTLRVVDSSQGGRHSTRRTTSQLRVPRYELFH